MDTKRLYRSDKNRVFAGICGGLGDYFNVDPTALRFAWMLIAVFTGFFPGVIAYIVAVFVVPLHPEHRAGHTKHVENTVHL